jgi:hypothetical protein
MDVNVVSMPESVWTIENTLTLLSLIVATFVALFAIAQWRNSIKLKRAEFLNQIIEKLRFDDDIAHTMYLVEYSADWYSASFHGGNLESAIDKLFGYMSYICYLRSMGNIKEPEFEVLSYEIHRTCSSPSAETYLWNLYHFSAQTGTSCTFNNLIEYGLEKKLFHQDFLKSDTDTYIKRLNFV